MKIAEVSERIANGDCSPEMMEEFRTALKRVPKKCRAQHCYTLAVSLPSRYYKEAIGLIEYGLTQNCDHWVDRMRSYDNMGIILELHEDFAGAKDAYRKALEAVAPDRQERYAPHYAAHVLRMELHIQNFEYSEELERCYRTAMESDDISRAFLKSRFYAALAKIVICRHHGDQEGAAKAIAEANEMLHPSYSGSLTELLKRKGFHESTGATKYAEAFLRRVK